MKYGIALELVYIILSFGIALSMPSGWSPENRFVGFLLFVLLCNICGFFAIWAQESATK
jgi:hypothetical protein